MLRGLTNIELLKPKQVSVDSDSDDDSDLNNLEVGLDQYSDNPWDLKNQDIFDSVFAEYGSYNLS